MELLTALELIAYKCEEFMNQPPEPFTHNKNYELYKLINTELQNIPCHFENIDEAKILLRTVFNEVPDREQIYQNIYTKVLIDAPEYYGIFRFINNMYFKKKDYSLLIKCVYSISIIRFIAFAEHGNPVKTKSKLTAPVIAAFCYLLNESKLRLKENDKVETYCTRICEEFNLPYSDNVRKNYKVDTDYNFKRNKKKVIKLILPLIDEEVSKSISAYLDSKEKLYG
jgi:hypothetical protein